MAEFTALLMSIVLESLFVTICAQILRLNGKPLMLVATVGTMITHPLMWKLWLDLSPYLNFQTRLVLLELIVFLVEGCIYRWVTNYSWRSSMSLSLGANLTSYTCGLLFHS